MSKLTSNHSIEAIAAAMWWADQLRSGLALTMALLARPSISEEQVQQFQEVLATRITEELEKSSYRVTLDCDYNPDWMLVEAASAAGIRTNMGVFPFKTTMHVRKDKVEVSCGYGAPYNTVSIG